MIGRLKNPCDREERLDHVRRYLDALGLTHYRAVLFGSLARGDFTAESDTDLLVISDEFPQSPRARIDKLFSVHHIAPEVEPVGWREEDWQRREREGDPFIAVLRREGIEIHMPDAPGDERRPASG